MKILQNKTVRPIHMGRTAENYCLTLKNVDAFVVAGSDFEVVKLVESPQWLAVEGGCLEAEGSHVLGDLQLGDWIGVAQRVGNLTR